MLVEKLVASTKIFELPRLVPFGVHFGTKFKVPVPVTIPTEAAVAQLAFPAASDITVGFINSSTTSSS